MKTFHVTVVDEEGIVSQQTFIASSVINLHEELERKKLWLITITTPRWWGKYSFYKKNAILKEKISFYKDLARLLRAGVKINMALSDLAKDHCNPILSKKINVIQKKITQGFSLSQGMNGIQLFSPLELSTIDVSEKTGNLAQCLENLASYMEWQLNQKASLKKVLFYPLILLSTTFMAVMAMSHLVLPSVVEVLNQQGQQNLSVATKVLLSFSSIDLTSFSVVLISAMSLFGGVILIARALPQARTFINAWFLKIPFVGSLLVKVDAMNFLKGLETCLKSHVSLVPALNQASSLARQISIKKILENIPQDIEKGKTLSEAIEELSIVGAVTKRLVWVGEKSGSLAVQVGSASTYEEMHLNEIIDKRIRLVGPLSICVIGGILLWLVFAILDPLYNNFDGLS